MLNEHRGEVGITLGGRKYTLRPTYQAIAEWETATGMGTVSLFARLARKEFTLADVVNIITAGLRGAGEPARADKVGPMIVDAGVLECVPVCQVLLTNALTGGKAEEEAEEDPEGEPKADGNS